MFCDDGNGLITSPFLWARVLLTLASVDKAMAEKWGALQVTIHTTTGGPDRESRPASQAPWCDVGWWELCCFMIPDFGYMQTKKYCTFMNGLNS